MGLNLPTDTAEVAVTVYHSCAVGASGSLQGPGDAFGYWWLGPVGLRVVPTGRPEDSGAQWSAILRALGYPGVARAIQDELAEMPS